MATFDRVCQQPVVGTPNSSTPSKTVPKNSPTTNRNEEPRNDVNQRTQVNFEIGRNAEKEQKHKYFTAKYGHHQMMLIRKRLAVEDWIYDKLRMIYNCQSDEDDHSSSFDLEEILDLDSDDQRRLYAQESLADSKQSAEVTNKFIEEVLEKARSLW